MQDDNPLQLSIWFRRTLHPVMVIIRENSDYIRPSYIPIIPLLQRRGPPKFPSPLIFQAYRGASGFANLRVD